MVELITVSLFVIFRVLALIILCATLMSSKEDLDIKINGLILGILLWFIGSAIGGR